MTSACSFCLQSYCCATPYKLPFPTRYRAAKRYVHSLANAFKAALATLATLTSLVRLPAWGFPSVFYGKLVTIAPKCTIFELGARDRQTDGWTNSRGRGGALKMQNRNMTFGPSFSSPALSDLAFSVVLSQQCFMPIPYTVRLGAE